MGACLSSLVSEVVAVENERLRKQVAALQAAGGAVLQRTAWTSGDDPTSLCDAAAAGDVSWLREAAAQGADLGDDADDAQTDHRRR